jgi:hypothetical protein
MLPMCWNMVPSSTIPDMPYQEGHTVGVYKTIGKSYVFYKPTQIVRTYEKRVNKT